MDSEISTQSRAITLVERSAPVECLFVIYPPDSPHYARRIDLRDSLSIGRGHRNDVSLPADCVSRSHCQIERRGDGFTVIDCGSKNGTYIGDDPVHRARLTPGDTLWVGDTIFKYLSGRRGTRDIELQFIETAHRMAIEDPLTGLPNRRAFDQQLARDLARARRAGTRLCLALFDLDHFKGINDGHGHVAGDFVLRELARAAQPLIRAGDFLARIGGEEFALLLPETRLRDALAVCERVRASVSCHRFRSQKGRVPVTVSIGVAELEPGVTAEGLLDAADQQMFAAKRAGRNRVRPTPSDA